MPIHSLEGKGYWCLEEGRAMRINAIPVATLIHDRPLGRTQKIVPFKKYSAIEAIGEIP